MDIVFDYYRPLTCKPKLQSHYLTPFDVSSTSRIFPVDDESRTVNGGTSLNRITRVEKDKNGLRSLDPKIHFTGLKIYNRR